MCSSSLAADRSSKPSTATSPRRRSRRGDSLPFSAPGSVLLLRCEAGPAVGAGHFFRCLAIAEAAEGRGLRPVMVLNESADALTDLASGQGLRSETLPDGNFGSEGAERLLDLARSLEARAVLLDSYEIGTDFLARLYGKIVTVMVDDLADRRFPVDILVNPSPGAEAAFDYDVPESTRLLLGSRYSLVRPRVRELRASRGPIGSAGSIRRTLVTLGGSPPISGLRTILDGLTLAGFQGVVDLVLGPLTTAALGGRKDPMEVRTHESVPDLPALMVQQDLAICGGGVTSLELACLGIPMLQVVVADNQRQNVEATAAAGASILLGPLDSVAPARVANELRALDGDSSRLAAMSQAGSALVDGQGAARVVDEIHGRVQKATPS